LREEVMTETEWLACKDPTTMLNALSGRRKHRKRRLLACGFCRAIVERFPTEIAYRAIEVAEAYADGLVEETERKQMQNVARKTDRRVSRLDPLSPNANVARAVRELLGHPFGFREIYVLESTATVLQDYRAIVSLIRCVLGNPFRPVAVDPAWLTWRDGTVHRLAERIYDDRRFADLPVLADALEEAGCTNPEVFDHCRSGGEHVRGCWLVDLLLGRK